jgi:hypothetical protein
MSVYVGIDVHRKRSQVAVVTGDGQVQLNKNVVNGRQPILKLIGGHAGGVRGCLRLGLASRAAGGLRVRPAPGAPAAVQGDRLGQAEERQGRRTAGCAGRPSGRRMGRASRVPG